MTMKLSDLMLKLVKGCQRPFRVLYLCSVGRGAFYCSAEENFFQCTGKIPTLHSGKQGVPIRQSLSTIELNVKN